MSITTVLDGGFLNYNKVQRETFHSAAELGNTALVELGFTKYEAYRATRTFKHHEHQVTEELYRHWLEDHGKFLQETRRFEEQVKETLQAEKNYSIHETDCAWDVDSLKDEAKKEK